MPSKINNKAANEGHTLTSQEPHSVMIHAIEKPKLLFVRNLCAGENVYLRFVSAGTCKVGISSPIKACCCLFAANVDSNYLVTPFPGTFQLEYSNPDSAYDGVIVVEQELPYGFSPDLLTPFCCHTAA